MNYVIFLRYHSLQYDAIPENSHQKADRKVSGGSRHGILKDSSYNNNNNNPNGIRQQSVSSNSKYSSSSSSSRDQGHGFSNDVEDSKLTKVKKINLYKIFVLSFFHLLEIGR